jgi:hypothetical protein
MMNRDEKSEYNRLYRIANKERIEAKRAERKAGLGNDVRRCSVSGCEGIHDTQGLCARHYMAWRRNGDPVEVRQHQIHGKTLEERFWLRVRKSEGCWEWTGARSPQGYGVLRVSESARLAHRISWELGHGKIPPGLNALHRCDNPGCVRPDHLFIGTHADNTADMVTKKRQTTKLSEEEVRAIRKSTASNVALAAIYDVSRVLIVSIRNGKAWKHTK